jgi:hypothetical protein
MQSCPEVWSRGPRRRPLAAKMHNAALYLSEPRPAIDRLPNPLILPCNYLYPSLCEISISLSIIQNVAQDYICNQTWRKSPFNLRLRTLSRMTLSLTLFLRRSSARIGPSNAIPGYTTPTSPLQPVYHPTQHSQATALSKPKN